MAVNEEPPGLDRPPGRASRPFIGPFSLRQLGALVATLAVAAVVLAERPSPVQLAGCVLILAGVVVAARRRRPVPIPAPT